MNKLQLELLNMCREMRKQSSAFRRMGCNLRIKLEADDFECDFYCVSR